MSHELVERGPAQRLRALATSDVSKILVGSLIGQGVVILSSPFLTRFFSPTEFGLFTVFTSVTAVLGVAVVARMDAAITLPRSQRSAAAVAYLAIEMSLVLSIVIAVVLAFCARPFARLVGAPELTRYWLLIPITVFVIALSQILSTWMVRERRYRALAVRNALQGIGQVAVQSAAGIARVGGGGLLIGLVAGRLASLGGLFSDGGLVRAARPRLRLQRAALVRYRRFPLIASWSALLNSVGLQVPLLVISAIYGQVTIGLLGLTMRVMAGPAAILGQAVAKVFQGDASILIRSGRPGLTHLVRRTTVSLLLIGAPITIVVVIFAPLSFGVIFGHRWVEAGVYARYLALGYLAQLIVSPVSQTLLLLEKQLTQVMWDTLRLSLTIGAPLVASLAGWSPAVAVLLLGTTYVACYASLLVTCIGAARRRDAEVDRKSGIVRTKELR